MGPRTENVLLTNLPTLVLSCRRQLKGIPLLHYRALENNWGKVILSHWAQYARRSFAQVDTSLWSLSYQRQENAQLAIFLYIVYIFQLWMLLVRICLSFTLMMNFYHLSIVPGVRIISVVIEFFVQEFTTIGSSIASPVSSLSELRVPVFSSM